MNWLVWALLSAFFAGITAILAKVGFLALSGLATGLSWLCYFRALQLGEASQVAPVDKLSVVFAIALAAVFLHERLTWQHWTGGGLILAGAILIALKF
jgi:transporter family protein